MTTKENLIKNLKLEYPTLTRQDDDVITVLSEQEYKETIEQWAENVLADESNAETIKQTETDRVAVKQSAHGKLAALGLTQEEVASILG
jgi:hypothetical protein